jgi:hypothetical protein
MSTFEVRMITESANMKGSFKRASGMGRAASQFVIVRSGRKSRGAAHAVPVRSSVRSTNRPHNTK